MSPEASATKTRFWSTGRAQRALRRNVPVSGSLVQRPPQLRARRDLTRIFTGTVTYFSLKAIDDFSLGDRLPSEATLAF